MKLGAFSISLSVKNLSDSISFYKKLGFVQFGGDTDKNYCIMKNDKAIIGLFQGMFNENILTFNPGWDENAKEIEHFDDVRVLQENLKKSNVSISNEVNPKSKGPAHIIIKDPDGNTILIDQHV